MQNTLVNDIQLVIVEDEAHNSRLLQGLIKDLRPNWKVEAVLESIEESVAWLNSHKAPDLLLMDIQLSDGDCFAIFDKVKLPSSCRIIFTTAYDEYAIKAFKVNSIDYLLKPIEKDALKNAFLKFEELIKNDSFQSNEIDYKNLLNSILQEKKEYRTRFLISGVNSYKKIETNKIAYFYSENKLSFAVDFDNVEHTLDYTLEQLESELNPNDFFRANRKVILNVESVSKIMIDLGGKLNIETLPKSRFEITVSRLKSAEFKQWMGK